MMSGYSPLAGGGLQRTSVSCTECDNIFIAELELDIDGEHEIQCPYCQHIHYRIVKDGEVTGLRWPDQPTDRNSCEARTVKTPGIKTSTMSHFLRDRWLNRSDVQ